MKKAFFYGLTAALTLSLRCPAGASIDNPNLKEFYFLGEYYSHTGQYEQAVSNYSRMASAHPNARETERGWLEMGRIYRQLMLQAKADLDKARAEGKATKKELEAMEAKVNSNMAQAISACRNVVAQFPASRAEAMVLMSRVYSAFGADKTDQAISLLQQVIDGYPEQAGRAQVLLGDLYASLNDTEKAKEIYLIGSSMFPEVASLAALKNAGLLLKTENYGQAVDSYEIVLNQLGIDNAYDDVYRPLGYVMQEALSGRGGAQRALKIKDDELNGYANVAAAYYGTNVGMSANMDSAAALRFYGRGEEATSLLKSIAAVYPRSVWAVKSMLKLAELQGDSPEAAGAYNWIISNYPLSKYWIDARMKLAGLDLKLAETEKDDAKKKKLRSSAANECRAIVDAFPRCPEGENAKAFLTKNNL